MGACGDLPVTQVQLDEMWSFIRRKHYQLEPIRKAKAPS